MRSFSVSVPIAASPHKLWALLADITAWPSWNPALHQVQGQIARNGLVKVYPSGPGRVIEARVATLDSGKRMIWTWGPLLGSIQSRRTFELQPQGDGTTLFSVREERSGWLAFLLAWTLPDSQPQLQAFADALKRKAES